MKHIRPLNKSAENFMPENKDEDLVHPMQVFPLGCTTALDPGVEVASSGGVSTLCVPWESDLFGCSEPCYWPAQVPDTITYPEWSDGRISGPEDWRTLGQIYPKK